MKIEKYIKDKQNKYKVIIDGETYILYDDIIVKYQLLLKDKIENKEFEKIIKENDELKSYYESIKYISKKLRSKKEIYEYLTKKEISKDIINKTIKRLEENNFLNEDIYIKAYVSDQINLSIAGPKKIKNNLLKLGIQEEKINDYLKNISEETWNEKIEKNVEKKIKTNHNSSVNILKIKITTDLINQGYEKESILTTLNRYEIDDKDVLKKEYEKARRTLSKKYEGYELEQKIKEKLYRKGFKISNIKELEYED